MFVLVQGAAEAVASSNVEVDDPGLFVDRLGSVAQWSGLAQGAVRPVAVVMDLELT